MATVSPVPLAMQPAVAAAAPGQSSKIHEAALRMLASLGAAIAKRPSAALSSALRAVAGKLGDVEPMSMMGDLHTPSVPSGETVPETLLKVVASSTKSKKSAADQALGEAGSDGWVSAKLPEGKSSYLITLAAPMHLSGIRFAFDKKHAPATVEVLAEDANTGTVVRMLDPASGSLFMEPLVVPFGAGIFSGRVVLRMTGSAKGGKDSAVHSLRSLAVGRFVSPPSPASGQMGSVVGSVAAMLAESCAGSDASLRDAALLALCNLFKATASGSVGMLLLNVLSGITEDLSPVALQAVRDTVRVIHETTFAACASLKGSGQESGGGWTTVPAKFGKIHSSARIKAGGARIYSESSDTWGHVNVGMSSGVHQWEVMVTEDSSGGECTCLGVSVANPRDTGYEHQSSFLLVRCFNGGVYNFGSSESSIEKIHPKDKVRFELNMDRGTLRCWIRGKDQGIIGSDLRKHKTLFPCVQFYSSGRETQLEWFKSKGGGGGGGAGVSKRLASMEHVKRSKKALPLGLADRTGDMSAALSLGGGQVRATQGVCVTLKGSGNGAGGNDVPAEVLGSAAAGTMVSWDVSGQSATHFRCMVGLCDSTPDAAAGVGSSPKAASSGSDAVATVTADESKDAEDHVVEAESKDEGSAAAAGDAAAAAAAASSDASAAASVTLRVLGDDKVLFESRPFLLESGLGSSHPAFAPEACVAKLDGCKQLSLVVTSTKPVPEGVHCVFADAELLTTPWLDRVEAHGKAAEAAMRLKGNDHLLGAKSGAQAALPLLAATTPIVDEAMGASHGLHLRAKQWSSPPSLMLPFVADPSAATVDAALELITHLQAGAVASGEHAGLSSDACAAGLVHALGLLSLQLRRLVFCGVHPSIVGFEDVPIAASSLAPASVLDVKGAAGKPGARRRRGRDAARSANAADVPATGDNVAATADAVTVTRTATTAAVGDPQDAAAPATPAAEPAGAAAEGDETTTLSRLRRMVMELGADMRLPAEVRACAAAVVDDNLPLFFPTAALRRGLVASLTSGGTAGAVEVAFKWPVAADAKARSKEIGGVPTTGVGATDSRFERAALLVHEGAVRAGMRVELVSQWRRAVHLVISVPEDAAEGGPLVKLLLGGVLQEALLRAGLSGWDFPEGIPTAGISCRIERLAAFDRSARAAKEPGNVVVRVFPSSVVAESGVAAISEGIRKWLASQAETVEAEEAAARAKGIPSSGAEESSEAPSSGSGGDDDSGSSSDSDGSSSEGSVAESSVADSSDEEPEDDDGTDEDEEEEEEEEGTATSDDTSDVSGESESSEEEPSPRRVRAVRRSRVRMASVSSGSSDSSRRF